MRPHTPTTKPRRGPLTDETQINVLLDTVTADGGSALLSYAIEINGTPFIGDPADSLSLDTIASGMTSGVTYTFRFRVRNVHGWSDYSATEQIVANTVPTKPLNAMTSNSLDKVIIGWDAPTSTGGNLVPLTSYKFFG